MVHKLRGRVKPQILRQSVEDVLDVVTALPRLNDKKTGFIPRLAQLIDEVHPHEVAVHFSFDLDDEPVGDPRVRVPLVPPLPHDVEDSPHVQLSVRDGTSWWLLQRKHITLLNALLEQLRVDLLRWLVYHVSVAVHDAHHLHLLVVLAFLLEYTYDKRMG